MGIINKGALIGSHFRDPLSPKQFAEELKRQIEQQTIRVKPGLLPEKQEADVGGHTPVQKAVDTHKDYAVDARGVVYKKGSSSDKQVALVKQFEKAFGKASKGVVCIKTKHPMVFIKSVLSNVDDMSIKKAVVSSEFRTKLEQKMEDGGRLKFTSAKGEKVILKF